jgi:hypothetical protein
VIDAIDLVMEEFDITVVLLVMIFVETELGGFELTVLN